MFFMGGGLGLVNAPATEAIMGALPPEKAGVGSAVNDTARELGGTLGVAIIGSLFASVYSSRLGELLTGSPVPEDAQRIARDSVGAGVEVARRAGEQAGPQAAHRCEERGRLGVHRRLPCRRRGSQRRSSLIGAVIAACAGCLARPITDRRGRCRRDGHESGLREVAPVG